jgi:DNA-3-methyladenine glycosylase II
MASKSVKGGSNAAGGAPGLRTIESADDLAEGLAHLLTADRRLEAVAGIAGNLPLRRREPGFAGLARIIVGQQLSVASASAIWERFAASFPELTPAAVRAARLPKLRSAGLSAPKIRTLKAVARACGEGLDLDALAHAPAEVAHARLVEIHGIGPWTADIYLLFCLGHPDVFPVGDLALRNAVADAYGLETPADAAAIAAIAEGWTPWRSVAATLFWAYYGARRARKGLPV